MKEYFRVKVLHTKGGQTGATMSSALLNEMPQPSMKKTPSNTLYIVWFDDRKTATDYMKSVQRANERRFMNE